MIIQTTCDNCGADNPALEVDEIKYNEWKQGVGLIQDIFPELTEEQRELLMTGICSPCWSRMFKED